MTELEQAVRELARTPNLLVASDYDGTLAPIVSDPAAAVPLPEGIAALRSLAVLPHTTAAVISGRSLRDLAALSRLPHEIHLVGSHGSEFDTGFVQALAPEALRLLDEVISRVREITADRPGALLETKPASVAVHVRNCSPTDAAAILTAVRQGPATLPQIYVTEGKAVIELSAIETSKGYALDVLRHRVGATAAIFIGDDVTDETAFNHMSGPDVAIKVGSGASAATYRVADPQHAAQILAFLAQERVRWLTGGQVTPIEEHALLADGNNVALLDPHGSVVWMCTPEPDAPALFSRLLGDEHAGEFSIQPANADVARLEQSYVRETMTVRTRWSRLTLTDYLDRHTGAYQTRLVRHISGTTPVRMIYAPRPDFGRVPVSLLPIDAGLELRGSATHALLTTSAPVAWQIEHHGIHERAVAVIDPATLPDGELTLELTCGSLENGGWSARTQPHELPEEAQRRQRTEQWWKDWVQQLELPEHFQKETLRSALTLKALCHERTGAILAAATTSLPEGIGGVRNWDYRYCWLRDGAMTALALLRLGSTTEADAFLAWLERILQTTAPEYLHPLYTLAGTPLGPEGVITELAGYAGSRPVRVSNAAQAQIQLDIFGPVCELIHARAQLRGKLLPAEWELLQAAVQAVEHRWFEPDHGIWEIRDTPKHHVHSKVMCWLTVHSALAAATLQPDLTPAPAAWRELAAEIRDDIFTHGWNEQAKTFTTSYGDDSLDAAVLSVTLTGLLEEKDPRVVNTVQAVESELRQGPTVYRYHYDDGLPGKEGGMHICTTWLIEAHVAAGQHDHAEDLFRQLLATAGSTGLLPEQYDPVEKRSLGNHPQAYSHLGVIRCALALNAAAAKPALSDS